MTLLTPPEEMSTALVLTPVEPPEAVKPEKSTSFIPQVEEQRAVELRSQAKDYTKNLVQMNPNSPAFAERISEINSLAQKEIVQTGKGPSRLLERSLASSRKTGNDATVQVASTLGELRNTVEDLTPNPSDLSPARRILGIIPGGKKVRNYFQKYESSQDQLNAIEKSLLSGQDALLRDCISLNQEKTELWDAMIKLNEFISFAASLDEEIAAEIQNLRASGEIQKADAFEADFLFPVRQRRTALMEQLAVAVQGYMSMELVRKNNLELIKGVERARTTTMFALRTAVIVSQALGTQGLVLDKIDALNEVTNKTVEATSIMLRQQTGRIHEQAVNAGVSVQTLSNAFDNIFATLDEVETFKIKANQNMEVTINGLQEQLQRAKPQLERAIEMEKREGSQKSLGR